MDAHRSSESGHSEVVDLAHQANCMLGQAEVRPSTREIPYGGRSLSIEPLAIPVLVASWIFAAYWFTASTSFANPAVTLARSLTDTFAGIRPVDVVGFVVAQGVGSVFALLAASLLVAESDAPAPSKVEASSPTKART